MLSTRHVRAAIRLAKGRAHSTALRTAVAPRSFLSLSLSSSSPNASLTYAATNSALRTLKTVAPAQARGYVSPALAEASAAVEAQVLADGQAAAAEDVLAEEQQTTSSNGAEEERSKFSSLEGKLSPKTFRAVTKAPFHYETMSEVQKSVLHLLPELAAGQAQLPDGQGRDLLVKARTGTGKTLGFLIPAIEARAQAIKRVAAGDYPAAWKELFQRNRPEVDLSDPSSLSSKERAMIAEQYCNNTVGTLVLSPTRELATQIANEARKLQTHHREMGVQLLVGGQDRGRQIREWSRSRPDVVVATPGRMLDMVSDVAMVREAMSACSTLVLDEADTLLEMGFAQELKNILQHLPEAGAKRHTMLFSATVSPEIRKIARASLAKEHRFIDCVPAGEENTHQHIPQFATVLPDASLQIPYILSLIAHDQLVNAGRSKVIVFAPTTRLTQLVAEVLRAMRRHLPLGAGSSLFEIHSKKDQNARFRVSNGFRQDRSGGSVLVTSDVSARGVDYPARRASSRSASPSPRTSTSTASAVPAAQAPRAAPTSSSCPSSSPSSTTSSTTSTSPSSASSRSTRRSRSSPRSSTRTRPASSARRSSASSSVPVAVTAADDPLNAADATTSGARHRPTTARACSRFVARSPAPRASCRWRRTARRSRSSSRPSTRRRSATTGPRSSATTSRASPSSA